MKRTKAPKGFALAVFLLLMPVLAMMTWTFLKVGSVSRAQAVHEERAVRSLHAAEAGIRAYLVTGQARSFELNNCEVQVSTVDSKVIATATPSGSRRSTQITLEVEKGFVTRRLTNEES